MQNKTTQKLITVSVLAVLAICGYFYFTYYIDSLTQKTSELKNDIQVSEIKYTRLESLRKATENTSDQKSKIGELFVGQSDAVNFIGKIENLAKDAGLAYVTKSVETEPLPGDDQSKELITINMNTTGLWSNTVKFLKLIETLPYSLKINSLRLGVIKGASAVVTKNDAFGGSTDNSTSTEGLASGAGSTGSLSLQSVQNKWTLDIEFSVIKIK